MFLKPRPETHVWCDVTVTTLVIFFSFLSSIEWLSNNLMATSFVSMTSTLFVMMMTRQNTCSNLTLHSTYFLSVPSPISLNNPKYLNLMETDSFKKPDPVIEF